MMDSISHCFLAIGVGRKKVKLWADDVIYSNNLREHSEKIEITHIIIFDVSANN